MDKINIYLDDERETPKGYYRTYSVEETIELIKSNNGKIYCLSFNADSKLSYTPCYGLVKKLFYL